MASVMMRATSPASCAPGSVRESGPPPRAFSPNSVATTPGITVTTRTFGHRSRSSIRSVSLSEMTAAFAALYADRACGEHHGISAPSQLFGERRADPGARAPDHHHHQNEPFSRYAPHTLRKTSHTSPSVQ